MAKKPRESSVEEGHVRVHDPFELVRWLALSQPDPRKALAELVQNSLDANARHIRIVRVREKGIPCLKILPSSASEGIPEPELVDAPGASWRSRLHEGRWQVNSGHPDYRASSARPAMKLRYLALLFAKEIVLRSSQDPRLEDPLEQVVEVAAYADRKLSERPPGGRPRRPKPPG